VLTEGPKTPRPIIDYMVYNRGSRDDFDAYAKIADDPYWSWDVITNVWGRKNEKWVSPNDGHDTVGALAYLSSIALSFTST
jgi:hypothetical protein